MWTVYLHPIRSTTDLNLLAPKRLVANVQDRTAQLEYVLLSRAMLIKILPMQMSCLIIRLLVSVVIWVHFKQLHAKTHKLPQMFAVFFVLYQLKYCLNVTCWQRGDNFKDN